LQQPKIDFAPTGLWAAGQDYSSANRADRVEYTVVGRCSMAEQKFWASVVQPPV